MLIFAKKLDMNTKKTNEASPKVALKTGVKDAKPKRTPALNLANIRYLDPKVDLTFRRIFGEHPDLLINFLNAVMPLPADRLIVEIEYLPSELMPANPEKKYSIVDVRCIDNYKRQFIIEMQVFWNSDFYNRIVFNAGKAYVKQLDKGDDYHLLQPVYTLALVNENFSKSKKFYHHYQIINRIDTEEVIPGLEFVLIELTDKFTPDTISSLIGKSQRRTMHKLMVLWLRFLKETNEKMFVLPAEMQKNDHIRKAAELCERAAFTPEELLEYEASKEHIRIERAVREGTRRDALAEGLEKGKAMGLEEGEAIGLEKGEAIGLEKGEAIGLEKGEAKGRAGLQENGVLNGHRAGYPIDAIAIITELTPEQVIKILKRHGLM
jgi:predicted transposase/invertase (TIGR01784 family)